MHESPGASPPQRAARNPIVPLIIGAALFVQVLDATVISTALPAMARSLGRDPVALGAAITTYLLALASFLPIAGWVADRFGAKRVFELAIVAFALSSLACGLSQTLPELLAARFAQGVAGSLMTPVGRIILLRSVKRRDLVWAMSYLTLPALLGPMLGAPVGGFIVTVASWRWIFFINLPLALAAVALSRLFLPRTKREPAPPLDVLGFLLSGVGLAGLVYGLANLHDGAGPKGEAVAALAGGALALVLYGLHARRTAEPLLDLKLLRVPTFRAAALGGLFGRLVNGANPFLLALLLQLGFGLSAFQAGLLTLANAVGALVMKTRAAPIVERFGFRPVLVINAVATAVVFAACGLFRPATPHLLVFAVLLVGGSLRALQFTALNGLAYADIGQARLSTASTFWSVLHQVTQSLGVSLAAALVQVFRGGRAAFAWSDVAPAFVVVAAISLVSLAFFVTLPKDAGGDLAMAPGAESD